MTFEPIEALSRFHEVLLQEIRAKRPEYLHGPFTVAEIYQDLVPYRTHRDSLGMEMNGDYEATILRLLAGEGGYLALQSEPGRREILEELSSSSPNTGLYRHFAAAEVRLNREKIGDRFFTDGRARAEDDPPVPGMPPSWEPATHVADPSDLEEGSDAPQLSLREEAEEPMEVEDTVGPPDDLEGESSRLQCGSCAETLPGRDNVCFCPFCGASTQGVSCASCGEELESHWSYCVACGRERDEGGDMLPGYRSPRALGEAISKYGIGGAAGLRKRPLVALAEILFMEDPES